jgi:hypothetical protein
MDGATGGINALLFFLFGPPPPLFAFLHAVAHSFLLTRRHETIHHGTTRRSFRVRVFVVGGGGGGGGGGGVLFSGVVEPRRTGHQPTAKERQTHAIHDQSAPPQHAVEIMMFVLPTFHSVVGRQDHRTVPVVDTVYCLHRSLGHDRVHQNHRGQRVPTQGGGHFSFERVLRALFATGCVPTHVFKTTVGDVHPAQPQAQQRQGTDHRCIGPEKGWTIGTGRGHAFGRVNGGQHG